jgi:hypothetical protein
MVGYKNRLNEIYSRSRHVVYNEHEIKTLLEFKRKYSIKKGSAWTNTFTNMIMNVSHNTVKVYCNDEQLIEEIHDWGCKYEVTEAVASIPKGILQFKRMPDAKFRMYLKAKRVEDETKDKIMTFLGNYPEMKPCAALISWLKFRPQRWSSRYSSSSHFIDFDDEGQYTLFLLYFGDALAGKFYELQKV